MDKQFDKEQFQKNQLKLILCCLLIGAIAIASIICAFTVGGKIEKLGKITYGKGLDPKDYYGEYYGEERFQYFTVSFQEGGVCNFTETNGFTGNADAKTHEYEYVSAKYAQQQFPNEEYEGCPAIIIYEGEKKDKAAVLWVTSTSPYRFVVNSNDVVLSTQKTDFATDMNDPKNYYGSYYSSEGYRYTTISFASNGTCTYTVTNGLVGGETTTEYQYMYVSAKYAQTNFAKKGYEGCPAIILFEEGQRATGRGKIVWITSTSPYQFVVDSNNLTLTTEKFDFANEMGDPKDYYATYRFNANTYVTFSTDGRAVFYINGEREDYRYAFVNAGWQNAHTSYNYNKAIICYEEDGNGFQIFKYVNSNTLMYNDTYTFSRE